VDVLLVGVAAEELARLRGVACAPQAVEQARARGLLGADVMGAGFAFDIELRRGAGAYICGEETALMESIEGKRGEPRNKPPFPTQVGLFGKPTAVNNVETLYNVLDVLVEGGPGFAERGTSRSTGTKLFCVSGAVARPVAHREEDLGGQHVVVPAREELAQQRAGDLGRPGEQAGATDHPALPLPVRVSGRDRAVT
jgi:NADH:ubiquinone oxidoreductase subunit F (NADH-binding)